MVFCCVPLCNSDTWTSDPSITFHEFPAIPELAAKWIQQINSALPCKQKPMWFPRAKSMICSKHFLQTDFKEDSDSLKNRVLPTIFGHKYIGTNRKNQHTDATETSKSPLIVNLIKPASEFVINDVCSDSANTKDQNETSETVSSLPSHSKTLNSNIGKIMFLGPSETTIQSNQTNTGNVSNRPPFKHNSKISNFSSNLSRQSNSKNKFIEPSTNGNIVAQKSTNIPKISFQNGNVIQKRKASQKGNSKRGLIEIGPNTFLKINPDIIKVNKKQSPSGNTVLQFVMDQKLANSQAVKVLCGSTMATSPQEKDENPQSSDPNAKPDESNPSENVVQHVLGHLVDTHVCKDSCMDLKEMEDDIVDSEMDNATSSNDPEPSTSAASEMNKVVDLANKEKASQSFLNKAPVLFTTNIPLSHCLMDKPKFLTQLKQKSRQIASLKFKIASLTKKVEELEDRCIVQERQLSYSFIKRLKTIRKNASKGDSCATYILEQVRCYAGKNKMRWSDSTLSQCAVWCRKAPYAYEYFKKADFFKLPCLGTVKRFMKKHPELKFLNRSNSSHPNEDDSSSDFDFDESDSEKEGQGNSDFEERVEASAACETVTSASLQPQKATQRRMENHTNFTGETSSGDTQTHASVGHPEKLDKPTEITTYPMTVDGTSLEVQEIILPSGEVVQCYTSNICNGTDVGNQYYIIPNVDQSAGGDHEYNVVQATDSLPVILQNLENAQLPLQQEQLIFITNSSDQLECTETEVVTAHV